LIGVDQERRTSVRTYCFCVAAAAIGALLLLPTGSFGWDSASWMNPTHPTHTSMTEYAIKELKDKYPEVETYRKQLIDGSNVEMHELTIKCTKYGVDFNKRRAERYIGTNPGCKHPELIWKDAKQAYDEGKKELAYFTLGILLHQIQDQGVPAHAHNIEHQGNATEFDNFEWVALWNWKPDFDLVSKEDPAFEDEETYADPSAYYEFARKWCLEDAPDYHSRDEFPKTWAGAEKKGLDKLVSKRQAASCLATKWALEAGVIAFKGETEEEEPAGEEETPGDTGENESNESQL
jgi:hypothetical protein